MDTDKKNSLDEWAFDGWRKLGFYYEIDYSEGADEWRFFGSKSGLQKIVKLIDDYISYPSNAKLSEHEHYGPYMYLKVMTWNRPQITKEYIAGTLQDFRCLKDIIAVKLEPALPGQIFDIDKDYGVGNTALAKFFVMSDDFDPATMDGATISVK